MQTVICMKWGTAYSAEYVNVLYAMVRRNSERPLRFVCFADDPAGLRPEVEALPLPAIELPPRFLWSTWRKISLWQRPLADIEGTFLFLDLDVVVTGPIDPFFDYRPEAPFCLPENWTQPGKGIGNTSVFRLEAGRFPEIFEALEPQPQHLRSPNNEQIFISKRVSEKVFWPAEWCLSFKVNILPAWPLNFIRSPKLPPDARVVCFNGRPKPPEARDGVWPTRQPLKRLYKHVRPTAWIAEHWR